MKQTFAKACGRFLNGQIALATAGRVKAYLIDQTFWSVDLAANEFLSSVPAAARVGADPEDEDAPSPVTLTVTVSADGVVDVADFEFVNVTGLAADGILYVFEAATPLDTTTLLLWYESGSEGLPTGILTNSTVAVHVDDGANKFGKLGDAA